MHRVDDSDERARDAATVVIFRDVISPSRPTVEILMVHRSSSLSFGPNAWTFPGGAIEAADDGDMRATAARETFEEVSIALDPATFVAAERLVTPPGRPRRYDTRFFACAAPADACPHVTDDENTEFAWISPSEALANAEMGEWLLMRPTKFVLEVASRFASAREAMAFFESRDPTTLHLLRPDPIATPPEIEQLDDGFGL